MSLFDSLGGALKGMLSQFESGDAPSLVTSALEKTDLGGIDGIVAKLKEGGLAEEVQSWLGDGTNLPISADKLQAVLGSEQAQKIADHFGIPLEGAMHLLAQHLPATVDQASSGGTTETTSP